MIKKLILYFDALQRFTPRQFFYWIRNKYFHKFINSGYPTCVKVTQGELLKRVDRVFTTTCDKPVWEVGVTNDVRPIGSYYQILLRELRRGTSENEFVNLWNRNDDDPEMKMNFQRFYLFGKAIRELQINKKQQLQIMVQWISQHSRKSGIAWSGFNCAIRIINWLKILYNLTPGKNYTELDLNSDLKKIQQSIFEQSLHNYRHIEHHIPGNHVLFQYISLWLVHQIWPEWKQELGKEVLLSQNLVEEISKEFKDNGLHFELSSHYHVQATLFCLIWFDIQKRTNNIDESNITDILINALTAIENVLLPDNSLPLIGDNCYPFWHDSLEKDIANIRELALQHFDIDIFKKRNGTFELESDWLIYRSGQQHIMMDVGELGLRENPGHGHSDLLSIIYSDASQPLFIDPGTYRYSNEPEALACKATVNHNTVSINGGNQAKLWGFFRWAFLPSKPTYTFENKKSKFQVRAQFSGFNRKKTVTHKRALDVNADTLLINDTITDLSEENLDIELNFILHPDLKIQTRSNAIILEATNRKWKVTGSGTNTISLTTTPVKIYPGYNVVEHSKKIVVRSVGNQLPASVKTEIIRLD